MSKTVNKIESSSIRAAVLGLALSPTERTEALAAYSLAEVLSSAIAAALKPAAKVADLSAKKGTWNSNRPALKQ